MFRNSLYVERYEDVEFELETPLNTTVANNAHQKKDGYRFVIDNTGEVTPFDWYNSRIVVDFKVNILASGADLAAEDHNGIVNGSHSLINNFKVNLNGKKVYDCNDANHVVNIKNLLSIVRFMLKQRPITNSSIEILIDMLKKELQKTIIIEVLLREKLY